MEKKVKYTFRGSNQDVTKSKHPFEFYYDAQHVRITSTTNQSTGSITNEKGNKFIVSIPNITINTVDRVIEYGDKELSYKSPVNNRISQLSAYSINGNLPTNEEMTDHVFIGHATTRDGIILFSTNPDGCDCIWYLKDVINESNYEFELLYLRNLGFSIDNPIQAIFNYENENIQKVYWVDGNKQIRFINIKHGEIEGNGNLIDLNSTNINFVSEINFSQPTIDTISQGGTHTAGRIQYGYNLYKLNNSQTKLSPLSELVSLGKGDNLGGGEVNEVVGAIPNVKIDNIDTNYDYIKVYAIKYTSFNEIPSVNLIEERKIDGEELTIYDDGSTIESLSLEELLFLGSDPIIPKHISSKDNRLFPANIKTKAFDIPKELDTRAYAFPINRDVTSVSDDIELNSSGVLQPINTITLTHDVYNLSREHSAINQNYGNFRYLPNSSDLGGEGKYLRYKILQKDSSELNKDVEDIQFLKDEEIYRIGIKFYNGLGQYTQPHWIADFITPVGNLEGNYNTLQVELKQEFYDWLNSYSFESDSDRPIGYKIIRANRTINDRSKICQGITSGMMVNIPRNSSNARLFNLTEKRQNSDLHPKLPNFLLRTFQERIPVYGNEHLKEMQQALPSSGTGTNRLTEIQFDANYGMLPGGNPAVSIGNARQADTYQYTAMMQMYSPEVMFESIPISTNYQMRLKGGAINTYNETWVREVDVNDQTIKREVKTENAFTNQSELVNGYTDVVVNEIIGNSSNVMDRGIISNTNYANDQNESEFIQFYREYDNYDESSTKLTYPIYGKPEIAERGQGNRNYNNNSKYQYNNTLEGFLTDGESSFDDNQEGLVSLNTFGAKSLTFVLGSQNADFKAYNRPTLEKIHNSSDLDDNVSLIFEMVRPYNDLYLGNIYGGNTYEDKRRTNYIEIGEYKEINEDINYIESAGDTYVQNFKFARLSKTDTQINQFNINQITEIVDYKVETSVDLKNRNDISLSSWDSNFQPRYEEYHDYNRVYSQQPTLVQDTNVDITFREIKNFDTRIQASQLKIPNESIDSWSDILTNEVMDLDGKYGPINNLVSFNDNIYSFQDEGIAMIQINPRVQVQADDGIGIELGTGNVLYDYKYLTTKSGSINKWGIIPSAKGIYYYDALNKGVGRVPDYTVNLLSDIKGYHSFFNNNYIYNAIKQDNPIKGNGVVLGYDNYNNDIYITLLQRRLIHSTKLDQNTSIDFSNIDKGFYLENLSFTKVFNEDMEYFIDSKTYLPSMYINKGSKLFLPNSDNNELYEQYQGKYNEFFGEYKPSYIILQVNPESDISCVFNNIKYNSEIYINDIDQPDKTLTHIQAYNEYQDSGRIPLIVGRGSNLRRKFREWQADIPRDGRARIRNPWIYLKLELDNESNYRMILHDIIVKYSV